MKLRKDKWETQKLANLCNLITDGTHFTPKYVDEGIPFLSVKNLTNGKIDFSDTKFVTEEEHTVLSKRCCPKKNDILYTKVGTTGIAKVIDIDREFSIFVSVALLKPKENIIHNYYLENYLNSSYGREQANALTKGTANRNLVIRDIAEIKINYPVSLEEQKQIAALFQSIETAMEQVDGQEKHLKALRKSLINKLTKQKPEFGNLLTKSNCNEYSIGELAVEVPDRTDNPQKSGIEKFIGLEDFESGELTIQKFSSTEKLVSAMKLCKQGDVLFARRNAYLKRASLTEFDAVCSGDVIVMRANEKIILPKFLILIMNTDEFWEFAISNAAGTMSKRVKWRDLTTYSFELPDLKTQAKILEVFNQLETTLSHLKHQKATLKLLKQKLLNEILG